VLKFIIAACFVGNTAAAAVHISTNQSYCGQTWFDADERCSVACVNDAQCTGLSPPQTCFANLPGCASPSPPTPGGSCSVDNPSCSLHDVCMQVSETSPNGTCVPRPQMTTITFSGLPVPFLPLGGCAPGQTFDANGAYTNGGHGHSYSRNVSSTCGCVFQQDWTAFGWSYQGLWVMSCSGSDDLIEVNTYDKNPNPCAPGVQYELGPGSAPEANVKCATTLACLDSTGGLENATCTTNQDACCDGPPGVGQSCFNSLSQDCCATGPGKGHVCAKGKCSTRSGFICE